MTAETSIENHYLNKARMVYPPQQAEILSCVRNWEKDNKGGITRAQIVDFTRIPVNAVSGRVNEMIEARLLFTGDKIKCPVTGRTVESLFSTPKGWASCRVRNEHGEVFVLSPCERYKILQLDKGKRYAIYKWRAAEKAYWQFLKELPSAVEAMEFIDGL